MTSLSWACSRRVGTGADGDAVGLERPQVVGRDVLVVERDDVAAARRRLAASPGRRGRRPDVVHDLRRRGLGGLAEEPDVDAEADGRPGASSGRAGRRRRCRPPDPCSEPSGEAPGPARESSRSPTSRWAIHGRRVTVRQTKRYESGTRVAWGRQAVDHPDRLRSVVGEATILGAAGRTPPGGSHSETGPVGRGGVPRLPVAPLCRSAVPPLLHLTRRARCRPSQPNRSAATEPGGVVGGSVQEPLPRRCSWLQSSPSRGPDRRAPPVRARAPARRRWSW